jgi:predicted nucleic acid-binding protein
VDLIIDASSIINLDNAGALELVASLKNHILWVSPLVVGECQPTCAAELLRLERAGSFRFVDPDAISADSFLDLLEAHGLGDGETECLALCLGGPYVFCCDDGKARQTAITLFGAARVIGSLRLLKWCVADALATSELAFAMYREMKDAGGFLPEIQLEWFSEGNS